MITWIIIDLMCVVAIYFIYKSDLRYWSEHPEEQPKVPEGWIPKDQEMYRLFGYNYYVYNAKKDKTND